PVPAAASSAPCSRSLPDALPTCRRLLQRHRHDSSSVIQGTGSAPVDSWVWRPVRSPARGRAPCAPSDPAGLPGVAQLAGSGDTDPQGAADGLRAARVDRLLGLRVDSALLDRLDQL